MIEKIKILILSLVLTSLTNPALAGWTGAVEVLSGAWGSGGGQFGLIEIETGVFGPQDFDVDKDGVIVIVDRMNKRIVIYNQDSTIRATYYKPAALPDTDNKHGWPLSFVLYPGGNSFVVDCEFVNPPPKKCFIDYNNNVVAKAGGAAAGAEVLPTYSGFIMFNYQSKKYVTYSSTGVVIKTSTERPLELGQVSSVPIGDGRNKITVKYPDKVWSTIDTGNYLAKPARDAQGRIYLADDKKIFRFDDCGKEVAKLTMPDVIERKDEVRERPYNYGEEGVPEDASFISEKITVLEEHGQPVLAPNGDVYTWKRTPDKYSIVKWTWVDDPNVSTGPDAPTNPTVAPSTSGLYLTWAASPQDPGCVTGYEISRSTSSGGIYTVLATVDKGILNYTDITALVDTTYNYKIRAKSGNDFSPYTTELGGKR